MVPYWFEKDSDFVNAYTNSKRELYKGKVFRLKEVEELTTENVK